MERQSVFQQLLPELVIKLQVTQVIFNAFFIILFVADYYINYSLEAEMPVL